MKIALLHYSSPPVVGGVESVLANHARLMASAGHQVSVFTGRGEVFAADIPVHMLPRLDSRHPEVLTMKRDLDQGQCTPAFYALRDTIHEELMQGVLGFDLLIAHNVISLHKNLPLTAALYNIYQEQDFPHLILWHHDLAWTTPRYQNELHPGYPWDLLCKPWKGVTNVVVSELRRRELGKLLGIDHGSIRVIPNGVEVSAFFKLEAITIQLVKKLNLLHANPLFLLPVRLTPRKNIEQALHIMAEMKEIYPGAMLLVTGPEGPHNPANASYREKLLALRDKLNLQGAAHFLVDMTSEFLPDEVITDCYRLADALLLPSREEGFGIPLIEAAFSGLPVFCADIPVLRELGGGDVSYFAPDAEPRQIALQIAERLEGEMTSRWSRQARYHYSWELIYMQHIAPLIQEVVR